MRPIIEFCTNNMHHGTMRIVKLLELNPDYDVVEYGCLGNCGECFIMPYAMVNGEIISAATVDELYEKIMQRMKEMEQLDALFDDLDE